MDQILELVNMHLDEIALFFIVLFFLIGVKLIISSFKMPANYYSNKEKELSTVHRILLARQLSNDEKADKLKSIYKD